MEGRSPGLATLKEAFDITYAVHRMEEEGARRRKYVGRGGGPREHLSGLNEDDEDEYDEEEENARGVRSAGVPQGSSASSASRKGNLSAGAGGAPPTVNARARRGPKGFELDMDAATLLGRRHQRGGNGTRAFGVSSPLAGKPVGTPMMDPGSPMRM